MSGERSPSSRTLHADLRLFCSYAHEYWIVDIDAGVVERWRPADDRPEIIAALLTWQPDARVAALGIDLARLFEEAAAVDDEPELKLDGPVVLHRFAV